MIFGAIRKIIVTAFKACYAIISFLYLQYTLLTLLVGLVLLITGVFRDNQSIYVIFWVILGLSVVLCVFLNLKRLAPKKRPKRPKVVYEQSNKSQVYQEQYEPINSQPEMVTPVQPIQEKPLRYLRVRQNPNYAVAEFSDRFELYLITPNGLKKIRADYK